MGGVDRRIVILSKENGGVASARNVGIEYALKHNPDGYLTFLDDDDFMIEDGIETLYRMVQQDGVEIAWGQCRLVSGDTGEPLEKEQSAGKPHEEIVTSYDILMDESQRITYSLVWGKIYKTSAWKEIRLPENCRAYDDGATTFKLLYSAGHIAVTDKEILNYCLSPQGITRNQVDESRCREALFTGTEKLKFYQEKKEKELYRMAVVGYLNDILDNMVYSIRFEKNQKEFYQEMKKLYRKNVFKGVRAKISTKDKIRYLIYFVCPKITVLKNKKNV